MSSPLGPTVTKEAWSKSSYAGPSSSSSAAPDAKPPVSAGVPMQGTLALLQDINALKPFSEASAVLDVACGPGTVFAALFASPSYRIPTDARLTATDISPGMIAHIHDRQALPSTDSDYDARWQQVNAYVCDAAKLDSVESGSQSHVLSQMGLFVLSDADADVALKEVRRVMKPEGVFGMTTVAKASWMQDVLGQISVIDPDIRVPFGTERWRSQETFRDVLQRSGFVDVQVREQELKMRFESPEGVVKMMWTVIPFMEDLTAGLTPERKEEARQSMVRRVQEHYSDGILPGMALVAVAR